MKILLIGGGGREHALALALRRSPRCTTLFVAPGNAGTAAIAEAIAIDVKDHAAVVAFCRSMGVGFVVVGPEAPLVDGLADSLTAAGIPTFGPSRAAAQLEGSKAFTKELCVEANIPTAAFARFTAEAPALAYVREKGAPIVIKADGLAAGKGVVVAATLAEAEAAVRMMFAGGLGAAGSEVVIEECLVGEEASFFALVDGETARPFASAQDHKRVGDGDTGPNTGGMGAFSPAPIVDATMTERIMREIVQPTAVAMARRGTPFRGILFAGLMLTAQGPKLIEYNVRFGDPECEVMLPRLTSDLVDVLLATAQGRLGEVELAFRPEAALTVVMAAKGYPEKPVTGTVIEGLDKASALPGVEIFHAGTRREADGRLTAQGGRVLAVTALAPSLTAARERAYAAVDCIDWPGGFCRRDIGLKAAQRERDGTS